MTKYDATDLNKDGETTPEEQKAYDTATPAQKKLYDQAAKTGAKLPIPNVSTISGFTNESLTSSSEERDTSTSSDVTIYSLNQVRNIATNAFENALGRMPTAEELSTFVSSLNAFSKANPQKSTKTTAGTTNVKQTTSVNADGSKVTKTTKPVNGSTPTSSTTSSGTTSGGVDVAGFAAGQLQNTAEARAVKVDDIFRGAMSFLADKIGG